MASQRPELLIQSDVVRAADADADLVCWQYEPGILWVWQFAHHLDLASMRQDAWPQVSVLERIAQHPLSQDLVIVPGPAFATLGLRPQDQAPNTADPDELVIVFDGEQPGQQLYRLSPNEADEVQWRAAVVPSWMDIAATTSEHNRRVTQATRSRPR